MKMVKFAALTLIAIIIALALSYEKIITGILLPQYIDWAHEIERKGLEIGVPLNKKIYCWHLI